MNSYTTFYYIKPTKSNTHFQEIIESKRDRKFNEKNRNQKYTNYRYIVLYFCSQTISEIPLKISHF